MRPVRPGGLTAMARRAGRPRRAAAGVVVAAASLLLTGCHVPGTSSAAPAPLTTLTVAAAPGIADAPVYVAARDGLFSGAGVKVRFVSYPSVPAEIAALQRGQADIAFGGYGSFFYAQAQANVRGQKLAMVIVAEGYDAASNVVEVLTLPGSGIEVPGDLAGKTIGTASPQNMPDKVGIPHEQYSKGQPFSLATMAATSVLSNDEVQALKPGQALVRWATMPAQDLVGALGTHQVQAILATEPQIYQAETRFGAVPVIDASVGSTANLPLDGYFSLRSFAASHRAALAAFRGALQQAQAAAAQPGAVQSVLRSAAKMNAQTASLVTLGAYPTSLSPNDLRRVVSLMAFYNMLPPGQSGLLTKMLTP